MQISYLKKNLGPNHFKTISKLGTYLFSILFNHFRTIYEQLGKVGEPEYQELCKQRLEEIEPSIRYCNYKLKGKQSDLADIKMKGTGMEMLQAKLDVSKNLTYIYILTLRRVLLAILLRNKLKQ